MAKKSYAQGYSGKKIDMEDDEIPGVPMLGKPGIHHDPELAKRDTGRIAKAVAGPHQHHSSKNYKG